MHFGIFMEFESRPGRSQAESFREGFDLVEAADSWGLDAVWLGEMHFNPNRSVLGARRLVVATSIANTNAAATGGHGGPGVALEQSQLRIAEEAATLDHISEGLLRFRHRA